MCNFDFVENLCNLGEDVFISMAKREILRIKRMTAEELVDDGFTGIAINLRPLSIFRPLCEYKGFGI